MYRRRWTKKEQASLLIQLGECLRDGYPLALALRLQHYGLPERVRRDIDQISKALENGRPFHEVLDSFHFSREAAASIYFAETGGRLAWGLIESGRMLLRQEEYREKLGRLLRYPLLLLGCVCIALFVVGRFLIPSFLRLYQSLSIEPPFMTRMMIFSADHAYLLLFVLMILFLGLLAVLRRFSSMRMKHKLKIMIRVPFAGHLVRCYLTYLFAFHLGHLLRSGLSTRQAVEILSKKAAMPFLRFEAERMGRALSEGMRFEAITASASYFLPDFAIVVHQGQINGLLGDALSRYSFRVMTEMEAKMQTVLAFCQPVLLIFVGGLVLGLFASVLLPIFQMVNGL